MFSHSQTVVVCTNCNTVLCVPTGGKARLTEGAWLDVLGAGGVLCVKGQGLVGRGTAATLKQATLSCLDGPCR